MSYTIEQAKDELAKRQGFQDWPDYLEFMRATKVTPKQRDVAYDYVIELYASKVSEEKDKQIESLLEAITLSAKKCESLSTELEQLKSEIERRGKIIKISLEDRDAKEKRINELMEQNATCLDVLTGKKDRKSAELEEAKSELNKIRGALVIANENTKRRGEELEEAKKREAELTRVLKNIAGSSIHIESHVLITDAKQALNLK